MAYEGFNKMICRISDDKRPHPDEISPLEEKLQDEAAEDRKEAINGLVEEMITDADYIADAFLADNELASDVGEILAAINQFDYDGSPATETLDIVKAWRLINNKLTVALQYTAKEELDE